MHLDCFTVRDARHHPVAELTHHVCESLTTVEILYDFPQSIATHCVEGFRQIHGDGVKLVGGEDHVGDFTVSSEASLAFQEKSLFEIAVEAVEGDANKNLPVDVEQWDSSVVISELQAPFQLIEMDDWDVLEILRNFSSAPYLLE
nr:unnamed protein product [Spirometra erinaceieuropaei]